nr:hypothetical protein [Candidatus Gracilibacteria bacterium]
MKKILKLLVLFSIFGYGHTFAAGIDHFEVTLGATEAAVNEAIDITIEAVDKNGNTVKDYAGTILILSETDPKAELPKEIKDNSYTFKESDQGKIKFENALKFKSTGKQELNIYDLADETILGVGTINITGDAITNPINISIVSPEDGLILGKNEITVTGKTDKNHQVIIKANGKEAIKTVSNDEGTFEEKLENLENGDLILSATVLDADNKEVGTSKDVKVTIDASAPEFKSIKILPSTTVDSESEISIEVVSDKGLKEASVVINDTITKLTEGADGVYTGKTNVPKEAGDYNVDVKLINDIGNQTSKKQAAKITVNAADLNSATEQVTATIDNQVKKIYKITNLELTKLKTKSILSWDKISEADSYNIYKQLDGNKLELVDNIKEPRYEVNIVGDKITYDYFVVEPIVKTESGETIKGELSEATKIQTGPKEILLLLILSMILGFVIMILKRRKA